MNFLAHLHLTPQTPAGYLGGLLPDFIRIGDLSDLDPDIAYAVTLHRKIDTWTDTHPIFYQSKQRIFEKHGRYSGILVDLFYDHALCNTWNKWHTQPLDSFIHQTLTTLNQTLERQPDLIPEKAQPIFQKLIQQNWLQDYQQVDTMRSVLKRMSLRLSARFKRPVNLTPAADTMAETANDFIDDFDLFYPDLQRLINKQSISSQRE